MVSNDDLKRARRQLNTAERKFESASDFLPNDSYMYPGEVVTHCQRSIEHSLKAVFISVSVQHPDEHGISPDSESGTQLINAVKDVLSETYGEIAARLLFISHIYSAAYPISEYGVDVAGERMSPNDFLDEMEASQAYNHADETLTLAGQLINRIAEESM